MKRLISSFSLAFGLCVIFAFNSFGQVNCQIRIVATPSPNNPLIYTFRALPFDSASAQCINPNSLFLWNFGNGQNSTLQNPTFVYTSPGLYGICVETTFQGIVFTTCDSINVGGQNCSLTFTFQPGLPQVPFTFQFNPSVNNNSCFIAYRWIWGDGTVTNDTILTPRIKTFSNPGIYNVCLIGFTQAGAPVEFCTTIIVSQQNPIVNISGYVSAGGACYNRPTVVELMALNGPEVLRDTLFGGPDSCYYYFQIPSQQSRVWTVRATPIQLDEYVGTYLGDVLFFDEATLFTTPGTGQMLPTINLLGNFYDSLIAGNPNPQGIISGNISGNGFQVSATIQGHNLTTTFNVSQARVVIIDANGNAVGMAMVQPNGSYAFPALPDGNYSVRVEYPGVPSQAIPVQIAGSGAQVNFNTTAAGIVLIASNSQKLSSTNIGLYPNPAKEQVMLVGMSGKVVVSDLSGKQWIEANAETPIVIQKLPIGMYLVKGTDRNGQIRTLRFSKN